MTDIATHPVQNARKDRTGKAPQVVTMRAYEVYRHLHGEQEAMVTGWYRGGFSTGELIAFLYAYGFPKAEWSDRCREAFGGMEL